MVRPILYIVPSIHHRKLSNKTILFLLSFFEYNRVIPSGEIEQPKLQIDAVGAISAIRSTEPFWSKSLTKDLLFLAGSHRLPSIDFPSGNGWILAKYFEV